MPDVHIGVDDTDSTSGGCTTYLAAVLVERLARAGVSFTDYPWLIRLNPNIPWKTRGNGAVALHVRHEHPKQVFSDITRCVDELSTRDADPAVVMHVGDIPGALSAYSRRALTQLLPLKAARRLAQVCGISVYERGRGLIGALAAIGYSFEKDWTYELLAYRTPVNRGKPRRIEPESVRRMDRVHARETYNNIDPQTGRILIAPHGPDPVLCGIRGESPEAVRAAFQELDFDEPVERWAIFRTNQGTGAHLRSPLTEVGYRSFACGYLEGTVSEPATIFRGGHVFFELAALEPIRCAVYAPTGRLREIARALAPGDRVRVSGTIRQRHARYPLTLNVELLEVLEVTPLVIWRAPRCPRCGVRGKSQGRGLPPRCPRCRQDLLLPSEAAPVPRALEPGLYLPPPRAQRHLTKPWVRYFRMKRREAAPLLPTRRNRGPISRLVPITIQPMRKAPS